MTQFQRINNGFDFRVLPSVVMFVLCFYFAYHLMQGQRSVFSFFSNMQVLDERQTVLDAKAVVRQEMLEKNIKLRPETLDYDYLEERGRAVLGYALENEIIYLQE